MLTRYETNFPGVIFPGARPRRKMEEALALVGGQLGRTYPLIIGGDRIKTLDKTVSRNPARITEVIGNVCDGSPELVDRAVQVATEAFRSWSRVPAEVRARYF